MFTCLEWFILIFLSLQDHACLYLSCLQPYLSLANIAYLLNIWLVSPLISIDVLFSCLNQILILAYYAISLVFSFLLVNNISPLQ